ncbi:uncharacterized protein LOC110018808 [Phalaenopsis equestris]|uniref:uncharacterized protein LOC110018808 n=1 Tax=Phalaenopsis equestris TaxID=78828 RepID=UPI0009E2F362|nr:uncharacterized protein LOC110018808 [Phalaenopsis equestris]
MSVVSHYMHDSSKGHVDAVYLILRYMKSALVKWLVFTKNGNADIEGFCGLTGRVAQMIRSTSRYCMLVRGNLVSWKSKKLSIVARSTTKAEYMTMTLGVVEMMWLIALLVELKVDQRTQMRLWCDNKLAIDIANNRHNTIEQSCGD